MQDAKPRHVLTSESSTDLDCRIVATLFLTAEIQTISSVLCFFADFILLMPLFSCRQADVLNQQAENAATASEQQQQSHQQTLALLDQAHMEQLSQLQNQLQTQSTQHSASESKLRSQLAEQTELTQQLQQEVSQQQHELLTLQKKYTEDQAVLKMLRKRQQVNPQLSASNSFLSKHDMTAADGLLASQQEEDQTAQASTSSSTEESVAHAQDRKEEESQSTVQAPAIAANNAADKTLALEAEVLRKEARILKDALAKAETAVQKLTQAQLKDQAQSSAKMSQLEGTLKQLEDKHQGSAALFDQTVTAIQSRTSILLQQRAPGKYILLQPFVTDACMLLAHPCFCQQVCQSLMNGETQC